MTVLLMLAALAAQYPGEGNDPDACRFDMTRGGMTLMPGLGERTVAPGEKVTISPRWTPYPGFFDEVPHRCLDEWRVSDRAAAKLTKDRRALLIAPTAVAGTIVTVSARYRGQPVTQQYRVIRPAVSPLIGMWQQQGADCPGADDVFELEFARDGSLTVTFDVPMHANVDYRGTWRADGELLSLGGYCDDAAPPPADRAAASVFAIGADGLLRFATPWFGHRAAPACTAAFKRLR